MQHDPFFVQDGLAQARTTKDIDLRMPGSARLLGEALRRDGVG